MNNVSMKEQLSALMDGELPRDETRFLLRRLDADTQLATTWSNYQIASDVLKKRFATPMPANFSVSVMQAIASEHQPAVRGGWLRWASGGAIAAAVAVVALTTMRPIDETAPQQPVVASVAPVINDAMTSSAEKQLQLPGLQALDYTQAASYDQYRMNARPPLIEARSPLVNPQTLYYYQVEPKP